MGVGLAGVQVMATTPASAATGQVATGLQRVSSGLVGPNSQAVKTARATCPAGKRVISGGAIAQAGGADRTKVQLTELQPVHPASGPDFFQVSANEISSGITSNWTLLVSAICADPISGLHIVTTPAPFNHVAIVQAFCPVGEVTLGGGGRIDTPLGHVGLSTVSPTDFDGSRFTADASTDGSGFDGDWLLTAYAVCAPRPPGFQIVLASATQPPNAPVKETRVDCPTSKRLHGVGAATFFGTGQAGVGLQTDDSNNEIARAAASGGPAGPVTVPDWGPVRSIAICAT